MRLAIFDLDYTIWQPEMYQLWGAPKLTPLAKGKKKLEAHVLREARTIKDDHILADTSGSPVRVFHGASHALTDINRLKAQGHGIRAAVATRTDEPRWARICLEHLVIEDGAVLGDCFEDHLIEISGGSKTRHLQRLHAKTGIAYKDMCFFDNEQWNILDVSRELPDVTCVYTPDGMTKQAWEKAKKDFGL